MRVHVDPDVCQGHGLCELSAPGVFHLREEDGQSYVRSEEVSPQDEASVRLAARGCPERAISLSGPGVPAVQSLSEIPHDTSGKDFGEFPLGIADVLCDVPGHSVLGSIRIFPFQGIKDAAMRT